MVRKGKASMKIYFETKLEAQRAMVELRKFVKKDVVVDIEGVEVSSMSGHIGCAYYVTLRRE